MIAFLTPLLSLKRSEHPPHPGHNPCQTVQRKALIDAINASRFGSIRVSFMNLMQWYAAIGDLELVLRVWDEYRLSSKQICTESYNIVMGLYVQMCKDTEAVEVFYRMIDEGAIPNSRTYTIVIEYLRNSGNLDSAMEGYNMFAAPQNEVFMLPVLIWNWDRFQSSFMGLKIVLHLDSKASFFRE
nr:pentatricopeptide repeat-containing protein [Quercus suber]